MGEYFNLREFRERLMKYCDLRREGFYFSVSVFLIVSGEENLYLFHLLISIRSCVISNTKECIRFAYILMMRRNKPAGLMVERMKYGSRMNSILFATYTAAYMCMPHRYVHLHICLGL